jgi:6-phosphogluconolactonase (cycloisomerase 2 family)
VLGSAKPEFLYTVALSGTAPNITFKMQTFSLNTSTGALTSTSTISWPQNTSWFAVDPASKFLYSSISNVSGNAIAIYAINRATGSLSADGSFSLNGGNGICGLGCTPPSGPGALTLSPSGNFLFYGSSNFNGVTQGVGALAVNSASGQLTAVIGSPFQQSDRPVWLAVHPSGRFLYTENVSQTAPGFALQDLSGFSVDSGTGVLAPLPGSPFAAPANASVTGLAMHPSGNFLYAATGLAANGILAWSVDSTSGILTALPGSPFASGSETFGGTFDPTGKFFYTAAGKTGGIDGFSVDSNTGALVPLASPSFASSSTLSQPAIDPSGHFLFAASPNNSIVTFSLDPNTGTLTANSSATPAAGLPTGLTIVKAP